MSGTLRRLFSGVIASVVLGIVFLTPASGQDDSEDGIADAAEARTPRRTDGTRGLQRLAADLNARERALSRRERTLGQREADLAVASELLAERTAELTEVRTALEELLDQADTLEQDRLEGLVRMTEKMREKQAAAFLVELDRDLAVKVVDKMNRTKAGRALAAMDPKKAAKIAQELSRPIDLPGGR